MAEIRIISHMNKSHKLAIEDYLSVYGNVIIDEKISNIKMSHIEESHMIITFKHQDLEFEVEKLIPFEPSMADLKEARVRLVEMAKYAANKRGFSHMQIDEMRYPTVYNIALIILIYSPLLVHFFPSLLLNSHVLNYLSSSFANWLIKYSLHITILTLALHAIEAYFIVKPKMEYYRVPTDYKLEWYIAALVEGYPSMKRFNAIVEERSH